MPIGPDIVSDDTPKIMPFTKIYANINTSNLKKVVFDIPTLIGETGNFTVISDTDILDDFYQGLVSFRRLDRGKTSIFNPSSFSVADGSISTVIETDASSIIIFTFEKVEDPDYNYKYNVQVELTSSGLDDGEEGKE